MNDPTNITITSMDDNESSSRIISEDIGTSSYEEELSPSPPLHHRASPRRSTESRGRKREKLQRTEFRKVADPTSVTCDISDYEDSTSDQNDSSSYFEEEQDSLWEHHQDAAGSSTDSRCPTKTHMPQLQDERSSSNNRKVKFGFTEVIELCMIGGDHPVCKNGPAVCLSSQILRRWKVSVSAFEEHLKPLKRTHSELVLSATTRRRIVRNAILGEFSLYRHDFRELQQSCTMTKREQGARIATKDKSMLVARSRDERFHALMARVMASDGRTEQRRRRTSHPN